MKNIHILPTDKPSRLVRKRITKELKLSSLNNPQIWNNINIYITSDEEIKEEDWVYCLRKGFEPILKQKVNPIGVNNDEMMKKIILTTDQDLIKDGVQAIDNEFLEWFIKNTSCEKVEVKRGKMKLNDDGQEYGFLDMSLYKIIFPKEEPKQECNNLCYGGGFTEEDIKRLSEKRGVKQETLEEAAKKYAENEIKDRGDSNDKLICSIDFIAGAKWQAEKMYSEEEVFNLTHISLNLGMSIRQDQLRGYSEKSGNELHKEWFEKFKKK